MGQAARGVENGIAQVRAEIQKERDQLFNDRQEQQRRDFLRILRSLVLNTHL
jgi:hypothetical protein